VPEPPANLPFTGHGIMAAEGFVEERGAPAPRIMEVALLPHRRLRRLYGPEARGSPRTSDLPEEYTCLMAVVRGYGLGPNAAGALRPMKLGSMKLSWKMCCNGQAGAVRLNHRHRFRSGTWHAGNTGAFFDLLRSLARLEALRRGLRNRNDPA